MGIITKGMGAIMKAKMKKAGVTKPTFPGPRAIDLLNKELRKIKKTERTRLLCADWLALNV